MTMSTPTLATGDKFKFKKQNEEINECEEILDDIHEFKEEIKDRVHVVEKEQIGIRGEIKDLRTETKGGFNVMNEKFNVMNEKFKTQDEKLNSIRTEMKSEINSIRTEHRITFGIVITVLIAIAVRVFTFSI